MSAAHPIFDHSVVFTFYFQQDQDRFIVCTSFRARVLTAYCKRALGNLGGGLECVLQYHSTDRCFDPISDILYICGLSFARVYVLYVFIIFGSMSA